MTMMAGSGGVTFSRAFLIPTVIVIGGATVYTIYQLYISSRRFRYLASQVSILSSRLSRLEAEVSDIRSSIELLGSSEDEEFVDANDAIEVPVNPLNERSVNGVEKVDKSRANRPPKDLIATLLSLDQKIEQGGLKNLTMAYDKLTQLSRLHPSSCDVFWRLSQAAFLLISEEKMENPDLGMERQNELLFKAKTAAENALKCDEYSGDAHKWMAVVLGSITLRLAPKNQVENTFIIKKHIDAALEEKPHDATVHHMKGRWCYSIYMMTWIERKLAATLFAQPPTATLHEATSSFERAEELNPKKSMDNLLYLGKVYIAGKKYDKAAESLVCGEQLKCLRFEDFKSIKEIKQLLKNYRKYLRKS